MPASPGALRIQTQAYTVLVNPSLGSEFPIRVDPEPHASKGRPFLLRTHDLHTNIHLEISSLEFQSELTTYCHPVVLISGVLSQMHYTDVLALHCDFTIILNRLSLINKDTVWKPSQVSQLQQ